MTNSTPSEASEGTRLSRVAYMHSERLQAVSDQLPSNVGRSSLVHSLIAAYGLLSQGLDEASLEVDNTDCKGKSKATVVEPEEATRLDLLRYHDAAYVDYLLRRRDAEDDEGEGSDASSTTSSQAESSQSAKRRRKTEQFGLEDDCPPFLGLAEYARLVAGSTLTAMRSLARNECDIAINWDGGRHHAMRKKASGFCYVADIVIGIMALVKEGVPRSMSNAADGAIRRKPRILYLDLDIHYGDGVAQAFHSPNRYPVIEAGKRPPRIPQVLTLSLHHSSPLFFPPPAPLSLLPKADTPHPFSLSIPLRPYPSCKTYARLMGSCIEPVVTAFDPDYVVLQLGLDGLARDPLAKVGGWALDGAGGVGWCVERVKAWGKPLCVLGGGGYHSANTARGWAYATSILLEDPLTLGASIPEHDDIAMYAPSFILDVDPGHAPDQNSEEHLAEVEAVYSVLSERIKQFVS